MRTSVVDMAWKTIQYIFLLSLLLAFDFFLPLFFLKSVDDDAKLTLAHCSTMISFEILLYISHCILDSLPLLYYKLTYNLQYVRICTCSQPLKAVATCHYACHAMPRDTQKKPNFCLLLLLRLCVPMS